MRCLIPVSLFRVKYELGEGRPYSQLQCLVLKAIDEEVANNLESLYEIFQVHRRILIEVLVTLTHEGRIAISSGSDFVLTSSGKEAVKTKEPPKSLKTDKKEATIAMERVTGNLIPRNEVKLVTKREIRELWDKSVRLDAEVTENSIDEGQAQILLHCGKNQWLRRIGDIYQSSKDNHWLPVSVDLETDTIVGLPEIWRDRLKYDIIEESRRRSKELDGDFIEKSWDIQQPHADKESKDVSRDEWNISLSKDHFLLSNQDHLDCLRKSLSEVENSIYIASGSINIQCLQYLETNFTEALKKGADIDIHWGSGEESCVKWLKKFAYDSERENLAGTMRFNPEPSPSRGNLILWDSKQSYKGCVGSFPWLSFLTSSGNEKPELSEKVNISVSFSHPGIVAALSRCAASFSNESCLRTLSSTSDQWRHIAEELDKKASNNNDTPDGVWNSKIRLAVNREHANLAREWMMTSQLRLLITSEELGFNVKNRLSPLKDQQRSPEFEFRIIYDRTDMGAGNIEEIENLLINCNGELEQFQELQVGALVSDLSACISGCNFLSDRPAGPVHQELGVILEGQGPADFLWNHFKILREKGKTAEDKETEFAESKEASDQEISTEVVEDAEPSVAEDIQSKESEKEISIEVIKDAEPSTEDIQSKEESDRQSTQADEFHEPEGIDDNISGSDYPIDSLLIRNESRTVFEVIRRIKAGRYILTPDFQRDFVWDEVKQSRLVESALMRIPLPVFYLAEQKNGKIVVVDGLQRLKTFHRYLTNELSLKGLTGDGANLNGKRFEELPPGLQTRIEDTSLILFLIDSKVPGRAMLDIFERVNSGEPLSRQQMRNCLYSGDATRWLADQARDPYFLKATGNSLNPRTMRDRELINRFCGFCLLGVENYKGDMDSFLAETLQYMNKMEGQELEELSRKFQTSMKNNHIIFKKHSFRKHTSPTQSRRVINTALFDVFSVALAKYDEEFVKDNASDIQKMFFNLMIYDPFHLSVTSSTNSLNSVRERFRIVNKEFHRYDIC